MAAMAARSPEIILDLGDPPEKPYHAKRPHKKSRSGCNNCKARKVKCDEAKPTCRSCRLRKSDCVYSNLALTQTKTEAATSPQSILIPQEASPPFGSFLESSPNSDNNCVCSSPSPSSAMVLSYPGDGLVQTTGLITEPLFRLGATDVIDMKLLWFYTTKTYDSFTFSGRKIPETIMKDILIRYAFETPFLLNSVFALSGLHLQNLNQPVDHHRALTYRSMAFEGYRKAIDEARPETFPALVANSLIMTALSSQNFRDEDAKDLYILDWLVVWKGINLMIGIVSINTLVKTGLNCLFFRPPIDLDKATTFIPDELLFMISSIPAADPDFTHENTYYNTIKYVGALYMYLRFGFSAVMSLRIITIFTFVPNQFIKLARERRPLALVILAHFALFFKIVKSDVWWAEGVGHRTLQDICNYLGPNWYHLLETPLTAINVDDRVELARLILNDPFWASQTSSDPSNSLRQLAWVDDSGKELCFDSDGNPVGKEDLC